MLIQIVLPLGLIVYFLFFRSERNKKAKKAAVYLGLLIFTCGLLIPSLKAAYFGRQREVAALSMNMYTIDFNKDFNEIKQKLGVKETTKIDDFNVSFEENGAIKELRYNFVTEDKEGFIVYSVYVPSNKNKYIIRPMRVKEWPQYGRLISEEQFLYALAHLDLKRIKPEGTYYTVKCIGDYTSWAVKGWDNFLITSSEPKKINNDELPVSGYVFSIFGSKSDNEGSYSGTGSRAYILSTER